MTVDISNCKICPAGFMEDFRDGKENYKDFRKLPHVACVKEKEVPSHVKEPTLEPVPVKREPLKSVITFLDFGFYEGRASNKVKSAQAYFFLKDKETGKYASFRHFNINTVLGQNKYGDLSDTTYEFIHGKSFTTTNGKKYVYPDPADFHVKVKVSGGQKVSEEWYTWFEADPGTKNVYCQPLYPVKVSMYGNGKHDIHNASCIAGNVKQVGFKEARERGLGVTGDFKEWIDMKDPTAVVKDVESMDRKELLFDHVDAFNEPLDFKIRQ